MFPSRTPGDIEAEILMIRQVYQGSFLLVEGPDDSKFWRSRISAGDCEVVSADGKPNVIGAIRKLDARRFSGALGVIDDDCDSLENWRCPSSNLVVTDARDLESMLLRSPALERVLAEFGDPEKVQRFQEHSGVSVKERLLENGLAFGRLRWMSKRQGWGLDFEKSLKPERFIDRSKWIVDHNGLLEEAKLRSGLSNLADLRTLLEALPVVDPWYICQGHDLVEILKLGLQKVLGNLKSSHGKESIAASLRLALDTAEFALTRIFRDIRDWEQSNTPFHIFPANA